MKIDRLYRAIQKGRRLIRGLLITLWMRSWGAKVGRGLEVEPGVRLRWAPHPNLLIGNGVYLGYGTILDAPKGSNLTLGNRVKIMNNVVIATSMSICIGANTQIAEFTSVRDSDHGVSLGESMRDQLISEPLLIGTDVWIGRGVAVLRGSGVGDGAVVGANSVVKHYIPSLGIAVGAPAKVIRLRTQEGEVR